MNPTTQNNSPTGCKMCISSFTRGEAIRYSVPDKAVSCLGRKAPLEPVDSVHIGGITCSTQLIGYFREIPECVGFHLCGAFMRNKVRNRGLLSLTEEENTPVITEMQKTNTDVKTWLDEENKTW